MLLRSIAEHPLTLVVLVVIVIAVFGANRLPGAARSLGRSMRIFKSEVKAMHDDDETKPPSGTRESPLEGRVVDEPASSQSRQKDV